MVLLAVAEDRKRWLLQHPLDLLIVVATPPFLPSSLQAARLLRLVRAVRVVRLAPAMKVVLSLDGLRYAAMLAVIAALGGGAAFASVEHTTTWIGVWWGSLLMTTVGYGDPPVTTDEGRVIGICLMLLGTGLVALLTGAVAQRFLASDVDRAVRAGHDMGDELEATEARDSCRDQPDHHAAQSVGDFGSAARQLQGAE